MEQQKKTVSVIIPNYNGRHLLETYLPHTFAVLAGTGLPFEVIVVDDNSTDQSADFIKADYPQINLIVSRQNKGFSHSCNLGIQAARYDLILLLNSDVKLLPGYFDTQWKYFERPDTFGVMGRIIDMEGDGIQDAARIPAFNGLKLKTAFFYYSPVSDDECYTLYLSGANALIDASKLKTIGGFDELFSPFYGEDLELSIRAWRMNWKCYYAHQAVCRHMGQASTKNYKTARWVKSIYYRNRFFVHALHLDGLARLGWFLQISIIDLLPKLLAGQLWMWQSYTGLIKAWRSIRASRKKLARLMQQNHSKTSLPQLVKYLQASVKGKNINRFKA